MIEKIKSFLLLYGTLTIALIALSQPWIVFIYRKFFRKGQIEIFPSGSIEIGYSGFGPTIGLNGTLRCLNSDFFVQSINIELTKRKDNSTHTFDWLFFRAQKASLKGEDIEFELAHSFIVNTTQPRRYNVLFSDTNTRQEIENVLLNMREEWGKSIADKMTGQPLTFNPTNFYNQEFSRSEIHVGTYTTLDRVCYWEQGEYLITLNIQTSKPNRIIQEKWEFRLTESDVKLLRLNEVKILQDVCGVQSYGVYNFANAKYKAITSS